ncbi:MAG: hypothetical protein H0M93_02490 [Methanophagales archaeon]|nr:hypothetical protein [Methanophagales archaeon]
MVTAAEILLSPPVAFVVFLIVGYAIFAVGGRLAPRVEQAKGTLAAYACGEDIPGTKIQPTYRLYHVGIAFTVLHVAALVIATMPLALVDELLVAVVAVGLMFLGVAVASLIVLQSGGIRT